MTENEDFDIDESEKEVEEIYQNFKRTEREGVQNILKYFDRIHDKLFTFNNILIAGYFALSQFFDSFSVYGIIIPILNLGLLLIIEYRMMEKSRFESQITQKTKEDIDKNGLSINKTTRYSLYSIISTAIVVGIFMFNLFSLNSRANTTSDYSESKIENPENERPENLKEYFDLKRDKINDTLIVVSPDSLIELGSPIGFVNLKGDTIIPIGKYSHCWTDTLKTYAIVFDKENTNGETVAIDRNENILFDIYFFDNGPDELSEGLFRVKRNDKIGYADKNGFIMIPCVYECAYPFENGTAKVAYHCKESKDDCGHTTPESEEWFYIDKNGIKITTPQQ